MAQPALAAGIYSWAVSPTGFTSGVTNLMTRPLQEADGWGYFKVDSLKFRLKPTTATGGAVVACFVPVQDTFPTTSTTAGELLNSCTITPQMTIPTEWVDVRKNDLRGLLPWYKAVAGTFDQTEEAPGFLRVVEGGASTSTFTIEVLCTMSFKTGVAAVNTPKAVELLRQKHQLQVDSVKEKERLQFMRVLGAVGSPLVLVQRTTSEPATGGSALVSSQISQQQ
jgi:hypothetical protein